jgi:transcription initiation factor TFIIE subunit beta
VDTDIKELVRGIELPRDPVDIGRELEKAGLKPAMNTAARKAAMNNLRKFLAERPREKKKRESKRTKYTNIHMPELFSGAQGMMPH